MKVKYVIEKKESEFMKKQLLEKVVKTFGTKASISGENIEVEKNDEKKIVDLLTHSGLKYQKAA